MSRKPLLVLAAGGTGGHMFPAQALAEHMLAQGWRVKLATDRRGARYAKGFPSEVKRVVLSSSTFARGGIFAKLIVPFQIFFWHFIGADHDANRSPHRGDRLWWISQYSHA